jgi:hypothetical protein
MLLTSTQRSIYIGVLLLQISIFTHATIIVRGNSNVPTQSFADPIQKFIFSNGRLYIGANNENARDFALSIANIGSSSKSHC